MLWHKAWLETRWRFLTGLRVLATVAMGAVFGYPAMAGSVLPIGEPSADRTAWWRRAIRESVELSRTLPGLRRG